MSKFHVYGLGNALVDYEYAVTPEWLKTMNIDKGVMTLMDEGQQANVISAIEGEPLKRASGGSGANSVIALSQLGGKAFYSCHVADDADGEFYANDLSACGVQSNLDTANLPEGTTGKCLVMVTEDADRTMCTYLGITSEISEHALDEDALKHSEWLYLEGYLVTSDTARAAAIEAHRIAKANGVGTALTLSDPNMVSFFKDGLLEMIGDGVDLLFANEEEAKGMTGTNTAQDALDALKPLAKTIVVTRSEHGALVFDGEQAIAIQAEPTNVLDTLGAGDVYAGAFLYGITHGQSYEQAGRLASKAAAMIIAQYGPRLSNEQMAQIGQG